MMMRAYSNAVRRNPVQAWTARLHRKVFRRIHAHGMPDMRGAICIIAATLAFLFLGEFTGLLPATFAIVFISALGDRMNTVKQALILSVAMCVIAVVVFWWALQLQLPLVKWGF